MNDYYEVIVTVSICGMKNKDKRRVCTGVPKFSTQRVLRTKDYGVQETVYEEIQRQQNRTVYIENGEDI